MTDGPQKISEAWIFVSHSHSDITAVRRVRDELEKHHANPLLFFLLCLDKDEELDSLIKREISARNFFLLCNSGAARDSSWVQKERDFVLSLKNRKVHELDLGWPWEQQKRVIHETLRSSRTFVNYSLKDGERVRPYIDLLISNDFAVYDDLIPIDKDAPEYKPFIDPPKYVPYQEMLERAIDGYFFAFISENWLRSKFARREFEDYLKLVADVPEPRLILAMLDPIAPDQLPTGALQVLDFSTDGVAENGEKLLAAAGLRSNSTDVPQ
jgi:hypothetical protein